MDKPQGFLDLEFRTRQALLMLLYLSIAAMVAAMLYFARPAISFMLTILSPFIVALIIAYMFNPIVNWLQRRFHIRRIAGVVITYAIILSIAVGFFSLLVPVLYGQAKAGITSAVNNFPAIIDKFTHWLSLKVTPGEMAEAREYLRENFDVDKLTDTAGNTVKQVTQQAFDTTRVITRVIGTSISLILGAIAFVGFVIVICFYFLLDYTRLEHIARVLLPDDKESRVFAIWSRIDEALGGYLRGQLLVASIVGVIYTVALMLMGMQEYAILIGFLAGIGNMIPYTGPIIGGVPAALWVLFGNSYDTGHEKLIGIGLIVGLSIAVQTLDGLFMQPRIVGKNAELHPIFVLLALIVGAQFGFGGMIIAVPVAIVVRVLLKELWWDPMEKVELESKARAAKKIATEQTPAPTLPRTETIMAEKNELATLGDAMRPESEAKADGEAEDTRRKSLETSDTNTEPVKPAQAPDQTEKKSRGRRRRRR